MTNVFIYILISSVMCSLCGASVLMLNRIIQGVSQKFKCAILTLAVLLPYVGIAITPVFPAKMTADIHTALYYPAIQTTAVDNAGETVTMTENAPSVTTEEHQDVSIDIAGIVAWLWFAGTAIMLTFSVIRYVRLNAALHSCRQATNTIGRIKVYSVSMSISPFLIGLFRPAIYIPANIYNNDELELVTAHEATHYRRGDLYLRLIIMFLNCVNWFNPLYHHVLKKLVFQTELACDEAVTANMSEGAAKAYGYILLKTAENGIKNEYMTVGLGGDAENLKRRIGSVMVTNKIHSKTAKPIVCAAFAVSALLCIGGCGMAMAVVEPKTTQEDEGVWMSSYFNDRSEVPQTLFSGKYYLTNGSADSYISVNRDGTLEIHCEEYFDYIERYETADRLGNDEEVQFAAKKREFLRSNPEYWYDHILGIIALKDPEDPNGERIYNRWAAIHTTEYDIMIESYDGKNFCFRKPVYEVNENGQTYGFIPDAASDDEFPDMIPAVGDNGKEGYVYVSDFHGDMPSSPEEAMKIRESMDNGTYKPRTINVYDIDGKTIIDTFTEKTNTMDQVVQNEDGTYTFIGE